MRDLFKLSVDYDATDKATQMFYAYTQNKLLFAVTGMTAAEIICNRANAELPNMGLTAWKGSIVRKQDVIIAKNYLTYDELDSLNRLVVIFLETAEFRAKNRQNLTMDFWRENVDKIHVSNEQPLLVGNGSISNKRAEELAEHIYDDFHACRKQLEATRADEEDMQELLELEKELRRR